MSTMRSTRSADAHHHFEDEIVGGGNDGGGDEIDMMAGSSGGDESSVGTDGGGDAIDDSAFFGAGGDASSMKMRPPAPPDFYNGGHIDKDGDEKDWPPCLPQANIKKIMQQDEDVRMVAKRTQALMARSCDCFTRELSWTAARNAPMVRNTLQEEDVLNAVNNPDSPLEIVKDYHMDLNTHEKKFNLPVANVFRCMKRPGVMPDDAKVSENAKKVVARMNKEFICAVTSEASDCARADGRATIQPEDVLDSLSVLGFADYIEPLRLYMQRLPDDLFSDSRTKSKKKGSKRKAAAVAAAAASEDEEDDEESEYGGDGGGDESDEEDGTGGQEADLEPPPPVAPTKQKRPRRRR
mmetsp:Transcript_44999/g.123416  ORF Transcript_44999/g.123416 Transcript_44999/m.123416 type:complete len:352 (+) Transcript_44999:131-1186(+)